MINQAVLKVLAFSIVVTVALAPSILVPYYLGRDANLPQLDTLLYDDLGPVQALRDGYLKERNGHFEEALNSYQAATKAKTEKVRKTAFKGIERITVKLTDLGNMYEDIRKLQDISFRLRSFILILILFSGLYLLSRLLPRRGIAFRPFAVNPSSEIGMSVGFVNLLRQEITTVARYYNSSQLLQIGVNLTPIDLAPTSNEDSLLNRALASVKEGDLLSVSNFSITELLRFIKNFGTKLPEYELRGNVTLLSNGAEGYAYLTRLKDGSITATWNASSFEMDSLKSPIYRKRLVRQTHGTSSVEPSARENSAYVQALSIVMACKIWQRLTQSTNTEMRPSTWQTIYLLVQSLSLIEQEYGS